MGLMTEAHKHNLNRNRVDLMKNLQFLPSIFAFLRQDYILTDAMQSEIQEVRTREHQVSKLIDMLSRRSDVAFERLVEALVHTHQDDLAVLLDYNNAQRFIDTRNRQLQQPSQQGTATVTSDLPQHMFMVTNYVNVASSQTPMMPVMLVPVNSAVPTTGLPVAVPLQTAGMQQAAASVNIDQISVQEFRSEVVGSKTPLMNINMQQTVDVAHLQGSPRMYSMDRRPRGRAVIISNRYFLKADLEVRDGAEFDESNLCRLFDQLHFDVQLYTNKSMNDMKSILETERSSDSHRTANAFVLVLLTHGSQGSVYGNDGKKLLIDDITTMFDGSHCPLLQNKPKLFFIQACQGHKRSSRYKSDGPTNIQPSDAKPSSELGSEAGLDDRMAMLSLEDVAGYVPPLPSVSNDAHEKADMLMAYASVKGYEAWRHSELGSWFVRTLVYVFQRRAHHQHIVDMLTEVNYLVSQLETEGTQVPYRQVAEKTDTLLKQLYFLPGHPAV